MAFFGWCLLAFAAAIVLSILNDIRRFVQLRRSGTNARGEVVGTNTYYGAVTASRSRAPVARFTAEDGTEITTELRWVKRGDVSYGNRIEVRYLVKHPKVASLSYASYSYLSAFWPLVGSVVFTALGVGMIRWR